MQTTRVTVQRPFVGGRLSPRLRVTKTVKGECFSGSSANPRRDAWRCSAGKLHLRPLFLRPDGFSLAPSAMGSRGPSGNPPPPLTRCLVRSLS